MKPLSLIAMVIALGLSFGGFIIALYFHSKEG